MLTAWRTSWASVTLAYGPPLPPAMDTFAAPTSELAAFGPNAGGWSSDTSYPRELADVTGDGTADIVGFGNVGVYVSHSDFFLI